MKGCQINMFQVGQRVIFQGGAMGHGFGTIHKLHRSGKAGAAEIKPIDGSAKITRSLRFVRPDSDAQTASGRIRDDAMRGIAMIERSCARGSTPVSTTTQGEAK